MSNGGRSTYEILRGLTLPAEDESVSVLGSAQINVNEAWREFVRTYGQAGDVPRLVRGASLPIGGDVVITVGLETLLGISGGPAAPVAMAFNVPHRGGSGSRQFYQGDWPTGVERFRVTGVRLHGNTSNDSLKGRVFASITVYAGLGDEIEVPVWGADENRVWALFDSGGSTDVDHADQIVVRDGPIYERSGSTEPVVVQVTWGLGTAAANNLACELHIEATPIPVKDS
ncbi:MAG: hypothetical protein OXN93_08690 [bacterium]|nr:hypothetical protein [bacterium]